MKNIIVKNTYLDSFDKLFYNLEKISPLNDAKLLSANQSAANLIDLNLENISNDAMKKLLNGEILLNNSKPYSMAYAGHQFGSRVPQLGDGRAMNIGTINGWHLQLKGSGQTKYSRQGDGRAVLRSSIREYLMSEAMHGLGIPTTRALAINTSKHGVPREWKTEKGAVVLRLSQSWIRIGSFEFFYYNGGKESVQKLANYVIEENYPYLKDSETKYKDFYFELVDKSAKMVSLWQSVGFMHGVLNTDNTSVIGVTLDYGPFAFMDKFEKHNICNHTDSQGRYSYANQPSIIQWNLKVLAVTLQGIVAKEELDEINEMFMFLYTKYYYEQMSKKLGLVDGSNTNSHKLLDGLLDILEECEIDYTNFFYILSIYTSKDEVLELTLKKDILNTWFDKYNNICQEQDISKEERQEQMSKINPKYVLKNYMIQEAIDKANDDDFSLVEDLLKVAQNPYKNYEAMNKYVKNTPSELSNLRLSCSS